MLAAKDELKSIRGGDVTLRMQPIGGILLKKELFLLLKETMHS